ncbi:uncharacterized protein EV422DRAFT_536332 [Fimicolochytrium jonesii]|uniref:uncharacterized protein n=1 Tax=Fimicolochytrium jonesii TaxID=1396493 RepID=UPI0022FE3017|nr:uncharacterized protein EV422DRAFT_536332 [Fimicolochytrium jonesii]KAI8819017.1 hypothetical protein EV422DRAFT_536332 [Fimicolochytrium jonesii]
MGPKLKRKSFTDADAKLKRPRQIVCIADYSLKRLQFSGYWTSTTEWSVIDFADYIIEARPQTEWTLEDITRLAIKELTLLEDGITGKASKQKVTKLLKNLENKTSTTVQNLQAYLSSDQFATLQRLTRARAAATKTAVSGYKTKFASKAAKDIVGDALDEDDRDDVAVAASGYVPNENDPKNVQGDGCDVDCDEEEDPEQDVDHDKEEDGRLHLILNHPETWKDAFPPHNQRSRKGEKNFGTWILSTGKDVAETLREARKAVLTKDQTLNPLYWGILDVTEMDPILQGKGTEKGEDSFSI